jgi:hypothetical protein
MAKTLTRVRELDDQDPKLGPQEELLFNLIGTKGITSLDLITALTAELEKQQYVGAQTPESMANYYQTALCKRRLIKVDGKNEGGARASKNQTFTRTRDLDDLDTKLSPMEEMLFGLINKKGITRDALVVKIQALKDEEKLNSKQDPAQIVALYHRDLMNRRLITVADVTEKKVKAA